MSKVQRFAGVVVALGLMFPITGHATDCASKLNAGSSVSSIIQCMKDQEAEIARLKEQQPEKGDPGPEGKQGPKGEPGDRGPAGTSGQLPNGIIVASTKQCSQLGTGWTEYSEASGRFIIGAGKGPLAAAVSVGQTGGEERVQLRPNEMPAHQHVLAFVPEVSNLSGGSYAVMSDLRHPSTARRTAQTNAAGGNAAHNNMPPFIALHFCRKG